MRRYPQLTMSGGNSGHRYCAGPKEKNVGWQGIQHLWQQQLLCDATLVAGDKKFQVHRCYLASCSEYFCAMFTGNFRESTDQQIEIQGVTANGLEAVLTYMYTGEIIIHDENIIDILEASSHLQVLDIQKFITKCLKKVLSVHNCFKFLNLSELYSLKSARKIIFNYMLENFASFSQQDEFITISMDLLCELLGNDMLEAEKEMVVLESAVKWLGHVPDRYGYAEKVLSLVRFGLMTEEEIVKANTIMTSAATTEFTSQRMVQSALKYHLNIFAQPIMQTTIAQPRAYVESLVLLGGCIELTVDGVDVLNTKVLAIDCQRLSCKVVGNMKTARLHAAVTVLNNFLFVVGGFPSYVINESASNTAFRFNPRNGKWLQLASMRRNRAQFALAAGSDSLIAVGGEPKRYEKTNTVEKYNFEENVWELTTQLDDPVSHHAGCTYNGSLYISGGYRIDENMTTQVQCFSLADQSWVTKSPMNKFRASHSMIADRNNLYVFGGGRDLDNSEEVDVNSEVYDIISNQWTILRWSQMPTMMDFDLQHIEGVVRNEESVFIVCSSSDTTCVVMRCDLQNKQLFEGSDVDWNLEISEEKNVACLKLPHRLFRI